jgi:hypothetical protein
MFVSVSLPQFLTELAHTYLAEFALVAVVAGWFLIRRLPNSFRSLRGANWPTAHGRIETSGVNSVRVSSREYSLGELGYSYCVGGQRYSGYCSQQFADEQAAWDYVDSLKGREVTIRYHPDDPAISTLRACDQGVGFAPHLKPNSFFSLLTLFSGRAKN